MSRKSLLILTTSLIALSISVLLVAAQDQTATPAASPEATEAQCGYTDEATSGPFYVSNAPVTDNLNLQNASGEPLEIKGIVFDGSTGQPIPNATIEAWHADSNGVYYPEAQGDISQYSADQINLRGTVVADASGAYDFTTIKPGIYEGRRRHIHYRISAPGYITIFTQTYWPDDPNIAIDGTDANTESCRYLTFTPAENGNGTVGTFDIYLRPDPNYVATAEVTATAEATSEVILTATPAG
jgi:protocatechuate 3,4-dioxygenase beta subunit